MSLSPEDADLSTRSAHESAFRVGSNGSPVGVDGSPVGQRVPHADSHCNTIPSRKNTLVTPKRSEEAADNAAAAQLPLVENRGLTPLSSSRVNSLGPHLLPAEPASATSTINAYTWPPSFLLQRQNYPPVLPRCVAGPNQRYSPAESPLPRLQELQNSQLTDSPQRLRFPFPLLGNSDGPIFTPNSNRRVGSLIDFEQNHQLTYQTQQGSQQLASVNHQQNVQLVSNRQPLSYAVHNQKHPNVTQIHEHYHQSIAEARDETHQVVLGIQVKNTQVQDQHTVTLVKKQNNHIETETEPNTHELDQILKNEILEQNHQIVTEAEKQNRTITKIQEETQIVPQAQEKNLLFASEIQEQDQQNVTEIQSPQIVIDIQDENLKFASDNQKQDQRTIYEIQEKKQTIVSEFSDIREHDQQTAEIQKENLQFATEIEEQDLQIVTEIQQQNHKDVTEVQEESFQFTFDTQNPDQSTVFIEIQEENPQFASDNQEQDLQTITQIQDEHLQFATYIQEHNEQISPEDQQEDELEEPQNLIVIKEQCAQLASDSEENNQKLTSQFQEIDQQLNFELQLQNQLGVLEIPKQNHQFASGVQEENLQPSSVYQQEGQRLAAHIQEKQYCQQEPNIQSNQVYSEIQDSQTEVESANEINKVQRAGELQHHTEPTEGRQHQYLAPVNEAPLPPAEARPPPTPEYSDISEPASPGHGEVIDPRTECIRKTFKLIREINDSLIANPEQPQARTHRLSILLLHQKLADICHKILSEAIYGQASEQSISLLREIFVCNEVEDRRSTKQRINNQEISMGLEILKRLRDLLSGWYNSKESESDTGENGTGLEARSRKGRGADRQPETSYLPRKRRTQEENPRLIKYRRVDNSFPRYITNETAEDLIPNKSMAERDQPQSSRRLSIFNSPVYTQHRVRNEAPYIPTPFDLSDDEEPSQTFASAGPSSRTMTYSDAVRLSQNGFGESRVNGHSSNTMRRAPAQVEKSILTHEMERMEHEQYSNLIHTVAHSNSVGRHFVKSGAPPPLHRIDPQPATWSSVLRGNQSHITKSPSPRQANRELTEYAKLIDRKAKQENRTPASPQLAKSPSNSVASHASTISSSGSSSSGSSCSTCSSSDSEDQTTSATDGSEDKKAKESNKSVAPQPLDTKPTRLPLTGSLHRRFANSTFLKKDFAEQFKARAALREEETKHFLGIAEQQAIQNRNERRGYEQKLRETIFNYRIPHKPIFILGSPDRKDDKVTKLIPLTKEHDDRYYEMMNKNPSTELVFKFNLHITVKDIRTLIDGEWLNDEVINFYMSLLTERSEKRAGELPATYAMNTFFVPRLLQAGHAGVKRWTRKVDLFSKDIIPVPVHCNGVHWCMAIIHLRNKTIRYYDSMGKPNQPVLDALEKYLREESLDKRKKPFDTSSFVIESMQKIPQQLNGSDCGVFSCMFAEYITRDVSITFSQSEMIYFRKKMALEIADGEMWQ
ncbi:uncharacterized protein LOC6550383 [Drosophila erecta]|uniref:Ubiquitin-like protease family profile domain-containing protein n=1 Tax=Drosophila erecta TaxID=7220 RepID=B3NUT0_DROER|nr:uncharacterized protein LOC6550383 [Drosophila erecta]EDV46677.1 uncharacterized protein Dere_GG18071 [Drosophila erecta]